MVLFGFWVLGLPGGSDSKEPACNAGDPGLIPGSERSPGEGNGYSFQYSCLENSMDREAWQIVYSIREDVHKLNVNTIPFYTRNLTSTDFGICRSPNL